MMATPSSDLTQSISSTPIRASLTPICIVVYLALHAIWKQGVVGPYAFVILRLFWLVGIAFLLILKGRSDDMRGYFIGRIIPDHEPFQVVFMLMLIVAARLAIEAIHPYPLSSATGIWGDCVIAPINEEMVFRGIFTAILLQYLPQRPLTAIGLNALIFVSVHNLWDNHGQICLMGLPFGLLVLGSLLGWIYFKSKSVLFCILCHAFWNLFSFLPLVLH